MTQLPAIPECTMSGRLLTALKASCIRLPELEEWFACSGGGMVCTMVREAQGEASQLIPGRKPAE